MKKTQILTHLVREKEISFKKLFNLFKGYFYYLTKNTKPNSYPSILMVEPTNFCNLNCPLCPVGNKSLKREKGFMPLEGFKKIIDELGDYLLNLTLWNFGEPMLHKDIYEIIEYAKRKKIFIRLSTNGHFFNNKENIKRLVSSGLDNLIVALDGASQETLSKYRVGANFEEIINGINGVVEEKKKLKSRLPFIELQFVIMKHNEYEVDKMKKIAKDIGVDKLTLKTVTLEIETSKEELEKVKEFLPTKEEYNRYLKSEKELKRKKPVKNKCVRLWLSSVINWNGDAVPCCYDAEGVFTFGNTFEKSFKEIWVAESYIKFRETVLKNKKSVKMCSNCPGTLFGLTLDE
ncbi:MAG: radical SAM protein [Candidatus Nealsonbacteria bacterium]|nr:radical SAM protein [Candidatus Nealsonbacteria bacterium]